MFSCSTISFILYSSLGFEYGDTCLDFNFTEAAQAKESTKKLMRLFKLIVWQTYFLAQAPG